VLGFDASLVSIPIILVTNSVFVLYVVDNFAKDNFFQYGVDHFCVIRFVEGD
jgi:hypothetical protein